jgi:hypothetical protein
MRRTIKVILACFALHVCLFILVSTAARGATVAEVAEKVKSLKQKEKLDYLAKGAHAEGELVYYGTLPIDEFLPLARFLTPVIVPWLCSITFLRAREFSIAR